MSTNDSEHLQNAEKAIRHLADPKALYLTLIHRWKWIFACTVLGVIVGCVAIKLTQKKFESTGKLLVHQKLPTFMDDSERLPDAKAYDSLFATHLQLIGSSMMIEKAIEQYKLDELPEITDNLEEEQTVTDYIRTHIKVARAGSGDSAGAFVIKLAFGHTSAKECPEVINALLKVYKNYLDQNSMDNQTSAVDLLTSLQKDLENDIIQKGQKFRDFIRSSPGVWDPDTLRNNHQRKISLLEEELTELEIRRTATASRIQIMDGAKAKGLPALDRLALVEEQHVPRLEMLASIKVEGVAEFFQLMYPERQEFASAKYDDLLNLFVEKTTLLGNLGPDHPRIQDLESDIRALESKLNENQSKFLGPNVKSQLQPDDLVRAYESFLKLEQGDIALRIQAIKKEIQSQFAASNVLLDYSFEATRLKDEYSRSQDLHGVLVDKMQKQKLISEFGTYTTQVIQSPRKGDCTWPNKPVILALFTMLGGFAGTLIAIALDLLTVLPTFRFVPIGFWRGLTGRIFWRRKNAW